MSAQHAIENPELDDSLIRHDSTVNASRSSRPKRDAKKKQQQDMLYSFTGMDSTYDAQVTSRPSKSSTTFNTRFQKVNENQDPCVVMYKSVMEPILLLDKLEVLATDKI